MIVDPVTVSIALASPVIGFGCMLCAAGYFAYRLTQPTITPAPTNPQIAAIEHELAWVVADPERVPPRNFAQARSLLDTFHEARRNQVEAVRAANRTTTDRFIEAMGKIDA